MKIVAHNKVRKIRTSECFLDTALHDDGYQRKKDAHALEIATAFNTDLIGVLEVSDRCTSPGGQLGPNGERYAIIDGGTRWMAATIADDNDPLLPCIVHEDLKRTDEARLFRELNTTRIAPDAIDLFRARLSEGDPEALDIDRIVKESGWRLGYRTRAARNIDAVKAVEKVYSQGAETLRRTLNVLEPWGDDGRVNAGIIAGTGLFIAQYGHEIDFKRLRRKISEEVMDRLQRKANGLKDSMRMTSTTATAKVMLDLYNKNRKTNRLESA